MPARLPLALPVPGPTAPPPRPSTAVPPARAYAQPQVPPPAQPLPVQQVQAGATTARVPPLALALLALAVPSAPALLTASHALRLPASLLHSRPLSTVNYLPNHRVAHPVFPPQSPLTDVLFSILATNIVHLLSRQLSTRHPLSPGLPSPRDPILVVVGSRSQIQMIRVTTRRIIARVADTLARRDRSIDQ